MARSNLNKSEDLVTNTIKASKYIPKYRKGPESTSIEIPSFRAHFLNFSNTLFYEVNLVSQC